jgi:putative ABC transport system permease protein
LSVGGVGIMNTMFTSVLQRTNEIGVMKAVGARNRDIALLFLIESGIVGLVGGAAGILAGMAFAKLVEFVAFQVNVTYFTTHFPWYLIVGSLVFAFGVGVLSGILPAIQAARMKPVDALRYE